MRFTFLARLLNMPFASASGLRYGSAFGLAAIMLLAGCFAFLCAPGALRFGLRYGLAFSLLILRSGCQ
jgi:hypothetical protein